MKLRRAEDQILNLLLARPSGPDWEAAPSSVPDLCTVEIRGFEFDARTGKPPQPAEPPHAESEDTVMLLDLGEDEALLIAGSAIRRIPRGAGGEELLNRAAAGAAAWRRERVRIWKRTRLPEQLIDFAERLNRAETPLAVCMALAQCAPEIASGYTAVILLRDEREQKLRAVELPGFPYDARVLSAPTLPRMSRPGVITAQDARADTGSPFAGLAPLFTDLDAELLAHVPFAENGALLLVERRKERVFEPEDWDLLGTLSRQASSALERVRLFHEVRSLSLADPLTGLANRRQMKVVLERALAAARRGEGLAVVMLDLDGFKKINDEHGHVAGDRILTHTAEVLRREARGADLVVRYGGDEFLVVLPGGNAAGAESFVRRVRERIDGQIEFSAGIAEYAPHIQTVEEMIEAADRTLYQAKEQRKRWG